MKNQKYQIRLLAYVKNVKVETSLFRDNVISSSSMNFEEFSPKEIRCGVIVGKFEYAITAKRSPYAVIKTTEKL